MTRKLTVGSLFAGIGGIELGLEWTGGFQTIWQVENNEYARRILERHWPDAKRWEDIQTFPPDATSERPTRPGRQPEHTGETSQAWRVDLICGGFPCQDISYAGKGAGLSGERSGLWWHFARVVCVLRPRYVLVENVAALLTRGLDAVLGTLASLGYDAEWHCIPAAAVGAPHIRDRVFILAYYGSVGAGTTTQTVQAGQPQSGGDDNVSYSHSKRYEEEPERFTTPRFAKGESSNWWSTECRLGVHPDGLSSGLDDCGGWECGVPRVTKNQPNRTDRLRCLGNAVVPQVAQWIGERILEAVRRRAAEAANGGDHDS
jgi:DNA (cytosine-5)-methyltransferase 1